MNKELNKLRRIKSYLCPKGMQHRPIFAKVCGKISAIELMERNYRDFMMRGEDEVFLAMMDKLGVKLDPKELRDFDLNNLQ